MKEITATGQTVDEAVRTALAQLNTTKERAEISILDEGKKGFLGIFGSKPAVVKVTVKEEEQPVRKAAEEKIEEEAQTGLDYSNGEKEPKVEENLPDPVVESVKFLKEVVSKMGITAEIEVKKEGRNVTLNLSGEKMALLIGKRGQTLNSLQYLTQLTANRYSKQFINIILDAEDYRKRRAETLSSLAERLADKAVRTNQDVKLEPMPSYERKVIHSALVRNNRVKTVSSGTEPNRYIIISPVK